jgi:hypothetical protein
VRTYAKYLTCGLSVCGIMARLNGELPDQLLASAIALLWKPLV